MRAWAGLFALVICLGCGPGRGERLRVVHWGGAYDDSDYSKLQQQLYETFQARNPGVRLSPEGVPGAGEYVSKVLLSFVAGSPPDAMSLDASSAAIFIESGLLQDLGPYIRRDKAFDLKDFFPNVVDIARRGDAVYAIPVDFTPMVMYYNKRLFRQAGVPYPKPGWTYDDFLSAAKRLTRDGRYGFVLPNWMPGWILWIWNNGGDVLSPDGHRASGYLDGPESVEAITFLRDLVLRYKVAPTLSQAAAVGVDHFANGQAAMNVNGHWMLVTYASSPVGPDGNKLLALEDIGVVEMPSNLSRSVTVMYEAGLAIGKGAKNPDAAWEWIKYYTSAEVQRQYNATGIAVCARRDIAEERAAADSLHRDFLSIVPSARAPWGSKVVGYDSVERIGQQMLDRVLKNGQDPQGALTWAAREIDEEFAKR